MERLNKGRREFIMGGIAAAAGVASVAWGLSRERKPQGNTGVAQAAVSEATPTPGVTESEVVLPQGLPTQAVRPTAVDLPQATPVENRQELLALRANYEAILRKDRELLNSFPSKIDANIVVLPLNEDGSVAGDLEININGENRIPWASLAKTLVLLRAIYAKPWDLENVVNGKKAYEMMVNSNNGITADYIFENATDKVMALDEINEFLWEAMGLSKSVGITNWTFEGHPVLRSRIPLEEQYVYDQRLVGIDNPATLSDTAKTLAIMQSPEKTREVAQKAWVMGYGRNHYSSFEVYAEDVEKAVAAGKVLMSQRCTDPTGLTQIEKIIDRVQFSPGTEADYGKGGTLGNSVPGWNRGRYVAEMRVVTLKKGNVARDFVVAYSAWSFRTDEFLTHALEYMVKMTIASR